MFSHHIFGNYIIKTGLFIFLLKYFEVLTITFLYHDELVHA